MFFIGIGNYSTYFRASVKIEFQVNISLNYRDTSQRHSFWMNVLLLKSLVWVKDVWMPLKKIHHFGDKNHRSGTVQEGLFVSGPSWFNTSFTMTRFTRHLIFASIHEHVRKKREKEKKQWQATWHSRVSTNMYKKKEKERMQWQKLTYLKTSI